MTTEVPQHPGHQPYPTPYPTAPPWAPAATTEPPAAYGPPYGPPLLPHGQLLVAYPEEMANAARPKPPALWPVAPFTFLFLVPGIVSAARRAARARRGRNSAAPYWITFAISVGASWLLWSMIISVGVPLGMSVYEDDITHRVEHNIVHDGQIATTGVTVRTATCEPMGVRAADGRRAYACLLTLGDGTGTLDVRADTDGQWTALGRKG